MAQPFLIISSQDISADSFTFINFQQKFYPPPLLLTF